MSDKQNWSAWLSEQLEACGDSIDADAFDAIVAELSRRPEPAPVGVMAGARKGFFDIDSGRACIVDRFNWPNHCGFKNVWIVDAVEDEQPSAVVDYRQVCELLIAGGYTSREKMEQAIEILFPDALRTLTNTDKGSAT